MPTTAAQTMPMLPAHWARRLAAAVLAAATLAAYQSWASVDPLRALFLGALIIPIGLLCLWGEIACHAPALRASSRGPHDLPGPTWIALIVLALALTGLLQILTTGYLVGAVIGSTTPGDLRDAGVVLALPALSIVAGTWLSQIGLALATLAAALAAWAGACLLQPPAKLGTGLPADSPPAPRRVDATRARPTRAPPLA